MAYASLAELKVYRGIAAATTSDDTLLSSFLASAEAMIDAACHRVFETPAAATTRYYDAVIDILPDGRTLYLSADLAAAPDAVVNGDGETIDSDDYVTLPRNEWPAYAIKLKQGASVSWDYEDSPEDAIQVTGHWGYAQAAPDDIKHATLRLAAYLYAQKDVQASDTLGIAGEGQVTVARGMPQDVYDTIRKYKALVR